MCIVSFEIIKIRIIKLHGINDKNYLGYLGGTAPQTKIEFVQLN